MAHRVGAGGEMRSSPVEAMSQRQYAQITWGHILTASVHCSGAYASNDAAHEQPTRAGPGTGAGGAMAGGG